MRIVFFVLLAAASFVIPPVIFAHDSPADILVLAPHPDDETLACGGAIAKAVSEKKSVKIIFITNGEAYSEKCAAWRKKPVAALTDEDRAAFGAQRAREATAAATVLGVSPEDIAFLGYPDGRLSDLSHGRRAESVSRGQLISDIKKILRKYSPAVLYIPHPSDTHGDHRALASFIDSVVRVHGYNDARPSIRYYIIHSRCNTCRGDFPGYWLVAEDIPVEAAEKKRQAAMKYVTQRNTTKDVYFFDSFMKSKEYFYRDRSGSYLKWYNAIWKERAGRWKKEGYQVNLAPVVDVAHKGGQGNYLSMRKRIFSDNPRAVALLAEAAVSGMESAGIVPVLKHFPGLGGAREDPHRDSEEIRASGNSLRAGEFVPYEYLLKKYPCWVMTSHAVYPALDREPASLSRKIQQDLLRRGFGFDGVIISDELLMGSLREYASRNGLGEDWIGEIVVRAFSAGTDIALFYVLSPAQAEKTIEVIVGAVKKAIGEKRLSERLIQDSLTRIINEKERIFGVPLIPAVCTMSIRERICQKLAIDVPSGNDAQWADLIGRYPLGALHVRDAKAVPVFKTAKIPIVMLTQVEHVPGDAAPQSASVADVGKHFSPVLRASDVKIEHGRGRGAKQLVPALFTSINAVAGAADGNDAVLSARQFLLSPFEFRDGQLRIRAFSDVPFDWLHEFPRGERLRAYQLLAGAFREEQKFPKDKMDGLRLRLLRESLIFRIRRSLVPGKEIRILCFAAHPDDEDGDALAYAREYLGCKTYLLMATRGEGGKSRIPGENDLATLRSRELRRAAAILGVDKVFYLGKPDFGYTQSAEETLRKWGEGDTLKKIVHVIRLVRPQLIVTRHSLDRAGEHGHHRALCRLMRAAFDAAGDPGFRCEDGRKELPPWAPLEMYERSVTGLTGREVVVDAGIFIPGKQATVSAIAWKALTQHRSQRDWGGAANPYYLTRYLPVRGNPVRGGAAFFLRDLYQDEP